MIDAVKRYCNPLARRISLMVGRAVLTALDDAGVRQFTQFEALKGEVKDGVERVQQYGFTSVPLAGAQVVFICVNGNRDHPIVISADDPRYRLANLQPGQVALYTDEGDSIIFKRGNEIEINTQTLTINATTKVHFNTPTLEVTGDIVDNVAGAGISMSAMRGVYNTHTHDGGPAPDQEMT